MAQPGGIVSHIDGPLGAIHRRDDLEHATAGIEKGEIRAVIGLFPEMQRQAEKIAIECNGLVHIADGHADMFEGFQHCERGLLSPGTCLKAGADRSR